MKKVIDEDITPNEVVLDGVDTFIFCITLAMQLSLKISLYRCFRQGKLASEEALMFIVGAKFF